MTTYIVRKKIDEHMHLHSFKVVLLNFTVTKYVQLA